MKTGFTLIELLLVVSLASALFLLGISSLGRFNASLVLETTTQTMVSEVRKAQAQAISEHKTIILGLANDQLPKGLNWQSGKELKFSASGYPAFGSSGTLILENNYGQQKKIIISSSGRVRSE